MDIAGLKDHVSVHVICTGFQNNRLSASLTHKRLTNLGDLIDRAQEYIIKKRGFPSQKNLCLQHWANERIARKGISLLTSPKIEDKALKRDHITVAPRGRISVYITLNKDPLEMLEEIDALDVLNFPPLKKKCLDNCRDATKYCKFHRDYGHITDECIQLKDAIEGLTQLCIHNT